MKKPIAELKRDIEFRASLQGHDFLFHTTWGLFSPQHIDEGTAMLIDAIHIPADAVVADIGCGYGAIGLAIAKQAPSGVVHMVDKDFVAVEYAQKNAKLNSISNVEVYLSNGFSRVPKTQFDIVVSNLPAKAEREMYDILFDDARRYLKPGGILYDVTISGLREFIKKNFLEVFGNYTKEKQGKTYTVASAVKAPLLDSH